MANVNIFVERSLKGAFDFFKEAIFSDEIAAKKGLFQSIGPGVKLLFLAAAVVFSSFTQNIYHIMALYLIIAALAFVSGVNIIYFLKRVWVFIPLFTLFIAIPAAFMQNLEAAAIFVARVATCVSAVVLVTITTRHSRLLKALKAIGVPAIFVQVLDMTYRYIFLFMKAFEEMHLSLKARLIKRLDAKSSQHWIAGRIGSLFRRSIRMSEEVYMAMVARGYKLNNDK